jgi:Uma2 family endonuclease
MLAPVYEMQITQSDGASGDILKARHMFPMARTPILETPPEAQPLITGIRLSREEFLRRWESLPELKKAELIEGIVFVPSPVGRRHSFFDTKLSAWLFLYAAHTPWTEAGSDATCDLIGSMPQPDSFLLILGGNETHEKKFVDVAPELVVEICDTSTDYDYGPKLDLYRRAGVKEYITVDTMHGWLVWRILIDGDYKHLAAGDEGVLRSPTFPGLWLNPEHVWLADSIPMIELLQQGIASPEHSAFVQSLSEKNL